MSLASIITTSRPACCGEQFGGAGVGDAAGVDRRLVHRAGDQAVELAAQAALGGVCAMRRSRRWRCADRACRIGRRRRSRPRRIRCRRLRPRSSSAVQQAQRNGERARRLLAACRDRRPGPGRQSQCAALGQSHAQLRTDSGRLARHQREPGPWHVSCRWRRAPWRARRRRAACRCGCRRRLRRAVRAGSGSIRPRACAGRWSRGPGRGGCRC